MKHLSIVLVVAAAVSSFGCKKKDGDAPASGSAAPSAGSAAVAAKPTDGCPANATKSPDNSFCVVLAPGMKGSDPFDKDSQTKQYSYSTDDGKNITVNVTTMDDEGDWESEVSSVAGENNGKRDPQASDLPTGGKFWSHVDDGGKTWATVLVRKPGAMKYIFCRTFGNPIDAAVLDACKSIRAL